MTRSRPAPSEDNNLLPADLDLGQIFIGREQQIDWFNMYLDRWKRDMAAAPDAQETSLTSAPSPNNRMRGLLVLLYGRGGFGKSTLLKHYHDIALQDNQKFVIIDIDWEFAIGSRRGLFNPAPGQEVDPHEYFRFLCNQLAAALKKRPDEFREYQAAVHDVEEARKQAGSVLDSIQKDERFGSLRLLAGPGAITLLRWVAPRVGQALDSAQVTAKVEEVIGQGAQIGAEQLVHAYSKLHDRLGHKLDYYLEPELRLGLSLGRDLARFARNYPLFIFFDTYEEVDESDSLLRLVMGAAGIRVGWVIAGRDNLWAGLEQRRRSVSKVYGYKEIVSPGLGLAIDFNIGGVGAFTASDIVDYFSLLRERAPKILGLPVLTEEDAGRILEVTQGVPLAVRIAAGLYLEQADLALITEKPESKREIVDVMVERYLLHTRDNQDERSRLYGLAMLRRADHPPAIAAALELSPEEARTRYEAELSRLQRRYSFIFSEKMQPSLHQEVRHFLRLWLRERRNHPEIMAINERLKKAHESALQKLEDRLKDASLRERLEDDAWADAYLDLVEQQFWLDPAEGVRYCLPFMLAVAIYRRDANKDAAETGDFFAALLKQPYRSWWRWAAQGLRGTTSRYQWPLRSEALAGLEELTKLASQRCPTFPQPMPDYRKELEAALWWRLGEAYEGRDDNKALEWYEKALAVLEHEAELREAAAKIYYNIAYKLYNEKKDAECIPFLDRAIELRPDFAIAYNSRGAAYHNLQQYQRAIEDYDRALKLDPELAAAYHNRGIAYGNLQQYQRAIEDYDRALELDPELAAAYHNRGIAYGNLQQYQRAIQDYDRALELDPKYALAYTNRGNAYHNLQQYQRAIQDYDHALELDPKLAAAYYNRGNAYDDLNEPRRAIEDYDRALELDPKYAAAYNNRGLAYHNLQQYQRAIEDYDRALELDPKYATAYYNRGICYRRLKEYHRAIQDYDRALELDPKDALAYGNRGVAYLWVKDIKQAITDFNQGMKVDPTDINAPWMAEWAGMDKERPGVEMAKRLEEIAVIDAQDYVAYVCRGVALGLRGRLKEGLAVLEQAISLWPEMWDAYFWKGMLCAYYYRGRNAVAMEAIEKALELDLLPVLLTPLYWLEKDVPDFFEQYAAPLLKRYEV